MMISSKGGPDGQPAMWESTIRGDLMNTRTTMSTLAWSVWRLAMLVGAIMLVTALPREVAAQSANATLRGKAPANAEVTAKNADTGFTRRIQAGERRFLRAGGPPARHLPGRCRSRDPAERHAGRRLDGDPGFRRRGASDGGARRDRGPGHAAERGQDVGGRRQHFAAPDRVHAADHAQLPRVRRRGAGHAVLGRCQGQHADPQRDAQHRDDQRLHRRRRAEELRAAERHHGASRHRYGPKERREPEYRRRSGQPVPSARHRRVQGHHVELQGRVRPGFGRRDHGGDQVRHQ